MADAICRWRNPKLETVLELINILPKIELPQAEARRIVNSNSPYDFYRTPYQLACQLGLYHETNDRYFPKFTYEPTQENVEIYLQNWIIHYCVPNPYTRGFQDLAPFSVHAAICRNLLESRRSLEWEQLLFNLFNENIGNKDILRNSLNTYSPILLIEDNVVQLKLGKSYDELEQYTTVDISIDRSNKEYFFDLFSLPVNDNLLAQQNNIDVIQGITPEEIDLLNQVQNIPELTQTQKNQIVAARIGQGLFRRGLVSECGFCPITSVDDTSLLVASHIKPWRVSNNTERLNPKNGLLLTPTYDKLFDKGFISFTNERELIVSPRLSDDNIDRLNLVGGIVYPSLPIVGREEFLDYHRNQVFR